MDGRMDGRTDGYIPVLDPDVPTGTPIHVVAAGVVTDNKARRVARIRQLHHPSRGRCPAARVPRCTGCCRSCWRCCCCCCCRRRRHHAGALLLVPHTVARAPAPFVNASQVKLEKQSYRRVYSTHVGSAFDDRVTLTFDPRVNACRATAGRCMSADFGVDNDDDDDDADNAGSNSTTTRATYRQLNTNTNSICNYK